MKSGTMKSGTMKSGTMKSGTMKSGTSYVEEGSRDDRCYNIAAAILELHANGTRGARTRMLREFIRNKINLPKLHGEDHAGDLRAHGDAIGGHGLHLAVTRKSIHGKQERVIEFTGDVIKKCKEYIEKSHDNLIL